MHVHNYREMSKKVKHNLEEYDRVTDIIGMFFELNQIPKDILERKKEIGTDVHFAIEAYFTGLFHVAMADSKPYIRSFDKWVKKEDPELVMTEFRLFDDDLKVTGCVDALIREGQDIFIIDFKTSVNENKETWPLQAEFYYQLVKKTNEYQLSDTVKFIKLDKWGEEPKIFTYQHSEELWQICLSYLKVYRYRK